MSTYYKKLKTMYITKKLKFIYITYMIIKTAGEGGVSRHLKHHPVSLDKGIGKSFKATRLMYDQTVIKQFKIFYTSFLILISYTLFIITIIFF